METFAEPPPHQLGYPEEAARPPLVCTQALICTSATSSGAAAVAAAASTAPLYDPLAAHENRPLKHLAINGRPEPSAPSRADNGRPEPSAPSRAATAGAGAAEEESLDVMAATRGMTRVLYEEYTNPNANYNDYYP
jgi:poly(3-hydroxybutyrate) depolymerase